MKTQIFVSKLLSLRQIIQMLYFERKDSKIECFRKCRFRYWSINNSLRNSRILGKGLTQFIMMLIKIYKSSNMQKMEKFFEKIN